MPFEQVVRRQRLGVGVDVRVLPAGVLMHQLQLSRHAGRHRERGGGKTREA
jgi:hypothetical protein